MDWLAKGSEASFPLQSWMRVAQFHHRLGRYRDARRFRIECERRRRAAQDVGRGSRLWSAVLRLSIGYGWELWRLGAIAVLLIAAGAIVAHFAQGEPQFAAAAATAKAVSFNSIVYALDTGLPIIDLGHEKLWIPTGRGPWGAAVKWYFWVHKPVGWACATLFVISFTGVARKLE